MKDLNPIDWIALLLVIIGGLNWGLVGLFDLDLVNAVFGIGVIADIVYVLVGLAALYMIYFAFRPAGGTASVGGGNIS